MNGRRIIGPLGLPITIIDDTTATNMDPADSLYVMVRIADADPTLGSPELRRRRTKTVCDDCRAPCWLDPKSVKPMNPDVARVRLQCAAKRIAQEPDE